MLAEFHFLRPLWLLALGPLALLLWLAWQPGSSGGAWRKACDPHLLPHLLVTGGTRSRLPLVLLGLAWLIAVLALAGPTWAKRPQPVLQALEARVIVLDLSQSMAAPDLKPSRLARARFKVSDMLARSREGQTGLVVFAGDAFAVSPLTRDSDTIAALLTALEPGIMPVQGSRVDLGLRKAMELLQQAGLQRGEVVVLVDSSNGEPAVDAARTLKAAGYSVSVLAVGTEQGAPIPTPEGGFLKDGSGNIVVPRLDMTALRELASAGGGRYAVISSDGSDLDRILSRDAGVLGLETRQVDRETESWREEGPWLVLLLIPLAALAFRRGWLLGLALLWVGVLPQPSRAFDWADLWTRRDQQAARALQQGEPERAAELAHDPLLRGTAAYRAGDYEAAQAAFAESPGADGHYNQGNALARMGRYQEAIDAYDAALQADPGMEDAQANRAAIEALLRQQQQQPSSNSGQGDEAQQDQQRSDQDSDSSQADQGDGDEQQQDESSTTSGNPSASQSDPSSAAAEQGSRGEQNQSPEAETDVDERAENETEADRDGESEPTDSNSKAASSADSKESEGDESSPRSPMTTAAEAASDEQQQMMEQWLRRIPDDPGGLLRRKFLYQYQRRDGRTGAGAEQAW